MKDRLNTDRVSVEWFEGGTFNILYTVDIPQPNGASPDREYMLRITLPVEPFYKTASEVATLSYLKEHTSIPVPRVIDHSSTAENELGYEWILMERIRGVTFGRKMLCIDQETKVKLLRSIVDVVHQLQKLRFPVIGNLYFRKDIDAYDSTVRVSPTGDDKYVIGPIVTRHMFQKGWKLDLPRNLGPYSNEAEYITSALIPSKLEYVTGVQAELEKIYRALCASQPIGEPLPVGDSFPVGDFQIYHDDLTVNNILFDEQTREISGIVDWECVGTRPDWEITYPLFLMVPKTNSSPDVELHEAKRGFMRLLDIVGDSRAVTSVNEYYARWNHILSPNYLPFTPSEAEEKKHCDCDLGSILAQVCHHAVVDHAACLP